MCVCARPVRWFCVHLPTHGGEAQGDLLVPVSGVDEAEGRVREQVGEEKIAGMKLLLCEHMESSSP